MNGEVRGTINAIRNKLNAHAASVDAIMSVYRRDLEHAKVESARFKNEAEELRERKARLASVARAQIADADKELAESVKRHISKLKGFVAEHVSERPSRDFIDTLRIYRDFDLMMERGEIDSLILSSQGNYIGLRALSSVAKQCGGWSVSAPSTEEYNKQIARLNWYAEIPIQYCSLDYVSEAADIYDSHIYYIRPDGSKVIYSGSPSTVSLITASGERRALMGDLEAMADAWSAEFVPQVDTLYPIKEKNEQGEEISVSVEEQHQRNIAAAAGQIEVESNEAEAAAAKIGKARADADRKSAEILSRYIKK